MEPGGHDAIMAFRVIFIFRQIRANRMVYKMPYKRIAGCAIIWLDGIVGAIISAIDRQRST